MYTQLKQPNLSIIGAEGLCLVFVREVFGVGAKYPTAASGWQNAQYKHASEAPPTDVSVPVWFNWKTSGHVAVSVPGKGIYSTTAQGDKVFPDVQTLGKYIGGSYLGWSEDINSVRIVEEVQMELVNSGDVQNIYAVLLGRAATPADNSAWVGQNWKTFISGVLSSAEFKNHQTSLSQINKTSALTYIQEHLT